MAKKGKLKVNIHHEKWGKYVLFFCNETKEWLRGTVLSLNSNNLEEWFVIVDERNGAFRYTTWLSSLYEIDEDQQKYEKIVGLKIGDKVQYPSRSDEGGIEEGTLLCYCFYNGQFEGEIRTDSDGVICLSEVIYLKEVLRHNLIK